ncbi:helix-turn-helix domain-containing protein [Blautia sp.]|uniref:helix-turn-helix domain-containing protein n=1 Tax=Blautia sp. TaxID=1955243 RepID=UPI0035204F24
MPNIELTENLRTTIRTLRKEQKKRGDELSKELGKGASYISQIENGKIKEIDFSLLNKIFKKITNLSKDDYVKYMEEIIDQNALHMTKEELEHEKWIYQFDYEIRKFPINDALIDFITDHLNQLKYTPEDFINIVNQNKGLDTSLNPETLEPNKLYIQVSEEEKRVKIITSIKFHLPSDYIIDIITHKRQTINYITMQGILYNIFLCEGLSSDESAKACHKILKENGFLTIKERNKIITQNIKEKSEKNEHFTLYDVQPTDFDKEYISIKEYINKNLDALRDQNLKYTLDKMKILQKNTQADFGLTFALMSSPLYNIPAEKRNDFWKAYAKLLKSFIIKSSDEHNQSLPD